MENPFATAKDRNFRQENATELEGFKATTGFETPEEMAAYEQGRKDEQANILKFIVNWDGATNSGMGALLAVKLSEFQNLKK